MKALVSLRNISYLSLVSALLTAALMLAHIRSEIEFNSKMAKALELHLQKAINQKDIGAIMNLHNCDGTSTGTREAIKSYFELEIFKWEGTRVEVRPFNWTARREWKDAVTRFGFNGAPSAHVFINRTGNLSLSSVGNARGISTVAGRSDHGYVIVKRQH